MRLARKVVTVLFLGVLVVLAAHALVRVRREIRLFEVDMQRDAHVMGRVLAAAAAEVWRSDGRERALRLIDDANEREGQVAIRYVALAPGQEGAPPRAPREALEPVLRGEEIVLKTAHHSEGEFLVTYVPVQVDGALGALELAESLTGEQRYIQRTILNTALATGAVALVCGLIATVIGIWLVGRPMQSLIGQARRVGAGDLRAGEALRQEDEIGELSREMNAMCERLAAAQARIEAESAARIAALEHLRHADRLATVGKLASGIAHELGAPLQVITGRARMLVDDDVSAPEIPANARIILEQGKRMADIIRQLLDFARRRGAERAPIGLRGLLGRTCDMLAHLAEKRRVRIEVAQAADEIIAEVDAEQVRQALTNLLLNGMQAMPRGGRITAGVRIERVRPPADVGGEEGERACVFVEDEGDGMTPEILEHIFEPFFTTKEVGEGTGLGLSVAWGIVREHGGWIDVRSAPGAGSRFSIYLPLRGGSSA